MGILLSTEVIGPMWAGWLVVPLLVLRYVPCMNLSLGVFIHLCGLRLLSAIHDITKAHCWRTAGHICKGNMRELPYHT